MPLSDAFAKTYSAIAGIGVDQARTLLMAREMGLREKVELSEEGRRQQLFGRQLASTDLQLKMAEEEFAEFEESATDRRRRRELETEGLAITNARNKLLNQAGKLEAAWKLEDRPFDTLRNKLGIETAATELGKIKSEKELNEARAAEVRRRAELLAPEAAAEKSELFDIQDRVSSVLDQVEELTGKALPSSVYSHYERRFSRAMKSGRHDLDQLTSMLEDEVSTGLASVSALSSLSEQMSMLGGQLPGSGLFGVPRASGENIAEALGAAGQRRAQESARIANEARLKREAPIRRLSDLLQRDPSASDLLSSYGINSLQDLMNMAPSDQEDYVNRIEYMSSLRGRKLPNFDTPIGLHGSL